MHKTPGPWYADRMIDLRPITRFLRDWLSFLFHTAGRITLRRGGRLLGTVQLESGTGTVLPGGARRFAGKIPSRIEPGIVEAKLRFELDRGTSTSKEMDLTIEAQKPPGAAGTTDKPFLSPAGLYCTSEGRTMCTTLARAVCTTHGRTMCTTWGRVMCTAFVT